jgi:segregation and condensation protein B
MSSLSSKIEAILYLKAQPLPIAKIAEYAGCERQQVEEGLLDLMTEYAHRDGALEVIETPNGYCLQLREAFHDLIQRLIPVDLGVGALRTLAAIALQGSISQTKLVELRGSGAYQHVQELVSLGFVKKRRQSDGRSYWLQVTEKFYQYFQVDKLPQPTKPPASFDAAPTEADSENLETPLE